MRSRHVCKTRSRRTELNAFFMYGFTVTIKIGHIIIFTISKFISYVDKTADKFPVSEHDLQLEIHPMS